MAKVHRTPCPLCLNPVPTNHIDVAGCPTCKSERTRLLRDRSPSVVEKATKKQQAADARSKAFKKHVASLTKKREEATQQAEIDAENKRIFEANKEQASLNLAKRSLLHYVERRKPDYKAHWPHELIAGELERFMYDVEAGKHPRLLLLVSSRAGKQLADFTEVFTANRGWTTHGDLRVGDEVFDIEGNPTKVVAVGPPSPQDVEIVFTNGDRIYCHEDHEWVVYRTPAHTWQVTETKELEYTRIGGRSKKFGDKKRVLVTQSKTKTKKDGSPISGCLYRLPTTPPLKMPEKQLPLHPYVLGAWLGDGGTGHPRITHHASETEVIDAIEEQGYERTYAFHHFKAGSMCSAFGKPDEHWKRHLASDLRAAGVWANKHIPELYLRSSEQQRLELLAGLIDTDGTTDKSGRVAFTTVSEELRDGYIALARSLGQKPYYRKVEPHLSSSGIQGKRPYYVIGFQPNRKDIPIRVPRKRINRVAPTQRIGIKEINRVEPTTGRCIQVESPYGVYLAGRSLIPTHNSELASNSYPAWLLGHHPEWEILLCSASDALPSEFSRSIRGQIQADDYHSIFPNGARLKADSSAALRWNTEQGGGIKAVGSKGTILGFGFNVGIFDDIHKSQEELENPERSKDVWDWFSSIAYSRQLPGAGIIVIMQRLADEDLAGRLMKRQKEDEDRIVELRKDAAELAEESIEGMNDPIVQEMLSEAEEMGASIDRWRVVEFPALAKADEYFDNDTHDIVHYPSGYVPDDRNLRPLRKAGEALHPARYSRNYYLKIKRNNAREFAAMFQLTPQIDETAYFNIQQIKRYQPADRPSLDSMDIVTAWDLAIGTKQYNDHTVGLALARDYKRRIWLLERVRGKWDDIRVISNMIIDLHIRWNSSITGIEKMMVEQTMGPILRSRMQERNEYINIAEGQEALKPISDKAVRARTFQGWVNSGLVYVPEGEDWDDYVSILSRFLVSNIDDDTDASAWGAILLNRTAPPVDPREENKRRRAMEEEHDDDDDLPGSNNRSYMEA